MKWLSKEQWFLPLIAGVSIILFLAEVAHAQNLPDQERPLSGPLPPNDPAAKLDPSLLNVPPMPEPQEASPPIRSNQLPGREVSHDIRTGATRVDAIKPLQRKSSTSFSPPNLGADSNIEPEFRRFVDPQ